MYLSLKSHKTINIANDLTITGASQAAMYTGFFLKEINTMLDAGMHSHLSRNRLNRIFVSHTHSDHCSCLPHIIDNGQKYKKDAVIHDIYVPEEGVKYVKNYVSSYFDLNWCRDAGVSHYRVLPAKSGIEFLTKGRKFIVETYDLDHSVPTVGYGFCEIKRKLKKEFYGKNIGQLRKEGVDVYNEVKVYHFCYLCDTTAKILENKEIYKYNVIMIECSYLNNEKLAKTNKHISFHQLVPSILKYPEKKFILFHFSARYSAKEVSEHINQFNLSNVDFFI